MSKIAQKIAGVFVATAVVVAVAGSTGCSATDASKTAERIEKGQHLVSKVVDGIAERAEQEGKGDEFKQMMDDCGKLVDDVLDHGDEVIDGIFKSVDETIESNKEYARNHK